MVIEKEEKKPDIEIIEPEKVEGEPGDFVVENDELFVVEKVEEESAEPSKKDGSEAEESGSKKTEKSSESESSEKTPKLDEATTKRIAIQDRKIELLEKDIKEANLTPDQIRQRVPLADMRADIKRQRAILAEIDKDTSPDEWNDQNIIVSALVGDITDKEGTEKLNERFNSEDNRAFLNDEKQALSDKGFNFSDGEWETIARVAENNYLTEGKYTRESIRKSLLDILGAEYTDKMYQAGAEQKLRENIKDASIKVTKSVRVSRSGVNVKLTNFTKHLLAITDGDVLERELDKLSSAQYAIYKKEKAKIQK